MPDTKTDWKIISVCVDPLTRQKIRDQAKQKRVSISQLIRDLFNTETTFEDVMEDVLNGKIKLKDHDQA